MLTKNDKIKISPEKRTEMFAEKDYLVKLLLVAMKQNKPTEEEEVLELEAIGLLNHYAELENEIYFTEKVNAMLESELPAPVTEKLEANKC